MLKKVYPPFLKGFNDKTYISDFGICSFETPSPTLDDLRQNQEAAVIQQLILACLALRGSEPKGKGALCLWMVEGRQNIKEFRTRTVLK